MQPKTRPDWLEAALAKHAPKAERDKQRPQRAQLQVTLRSEDPAAREIAKQTIKDKLKPKKR